MTRTTIFVAMLTASGLLLANAAAAQPKPQPTPYVAPPEPAAQDKGAGEVASEEAETFPVLAVTSVEILRSTTTPTIDVIVVNGVTSADGWSNGTLVPTRHGNSTDGVLDLVFVAEAPKESAELGDYVPIQAVLPITEGHPFHAVRVRGATNSVLLHDLPGHAETPRPEQACKACVGKIFIAKGAATPANAGSAEVVAEEKLPPNVRVVHQADGFADVTHNPNRLTIIVGEDGRIADAAWE